MYCIYNSRCPDVSSSRDASFHRHTKMYLTITFWKSKQIEHFKSLNCSFCSDLQLCHWIFFLNSHFLDLKIWVENIFPNFFQIFKKKIYDLTLDPQKSQNLLTKKFQKIMNVLSSKLYQTKLKNWIYLN